MIKGIIKLLIVVSIILSLAIVTGSTALADPTPGEITTPEGIGFYEGTIFDYSGDSATLDIPSTINGIPVVAIGDHAFENCDTLENITIPSSVTSIGSVVFCDCNNLESINVSESNPNYCSVDGALFNKTKTVLIQYPLGKDQTNYTIPSSVTTIGENSFTGSDVLESVIIPNGVTMLGNYAFSYCEALTTMTIPSSVATIGNYAFYNCNLLESIIIEDGVTTIGESAFYNCNAVISVNVPASVTSIEPYAFDACDMLTSINVLADNLHYCSVDGVLFNKSKTVLVQYPVGKNGAYAIPSSVTSIGMGAFKGSGLTGLSIPRSVTRIPESTFYRCQSLAKIIIPSSVTSIGNNAFYRCYNLTIYGEQDSEALVYAYEHSIPFLKFCDEIKDNKLHRIYYHNNGKKDKEAVYFGTTSDSGVYKVNYYTNGVRTSYKLYNESRELINLVELHSNGKTKKTNYYNTDTGIRTSYKLYDTQERMTHFTTCYSDGVKPQKTNYYNVNTGERTSYKLYDTAGRTTHLIDCHPGGVKPKKTNYYDVDTGTRTSYKLYDTQGRTTHYAICYSDGIKASKMNYYDVNTGFRIAYKTYRTDGSCSCHVICDSEGNPSVATYYDKNGNVTKVVHY